MPPRAAQIHDINERTFGQWYSSVPVVTRALLTIYVGTGLALFFKLLPIAYCYHSWGLVFKLPVPEVWRLLTNFTIIGAPSINFLFQLIWLVRYGAAYESSKFGGNTADAITMLLVGAASILVLDALLPFLFHSFFHGASLIFMMLYLWSKQNPDTIVGFFGVIQFKALYLPFALLALDVIQGASPKAGVLGILAGHVYYFLTEVYPQSSGRHLISTPTWLARAVHRYGLGAVPVQQLNAVNPTNPLFRAFTGRGRQLGRVAAD